MAPKKKETQKMSLGEFLGPAMGSWADEVEEQVASGTQPLPPSDRARPGMGSSFGGDRFAGYARQEPAGPPKIPTRPPFTAHLGNLPYDATVDSVTDFFGDCGVVNVRIIEDRELQRPKGFAYVEFNDADGLKRALEFDQQSFNGRYIKVRVADPPRESRAESMRDLDWSRKGPLPDLPRDNSRRREDFGERRGPPRDFAEGEGKSRDFGNWERKGPLSPLPQAAPPMSRGGSRRGMHDGPPPDRARRQSPAAWGEGRQDSRPPHREFWEKTERVSSAAERDMQWRSNMRPDAPSRASAPQSRDGSAPSSPAPAAAVPVATGGRPKLNLAKRTVSEATDLASPSTAGDSKASPFGAARPIDTAAREREIEEKRQQAIKEKREAEEKAKEERRLAKEAAAKAEADAAAAAEADAAAAAEKAESEKSETAAAPAEPAKESVDAVKEQPSSPTGAQESNNGGSQERKVPVRPREPREPREHRGEGRPEFKSRASESGNWRSASGEHRPRGAPSGPRRGSGGPPRGPRYGGGPNRANGNSANQQPPPTPTTAEGETKDEDGWTTVPRGGRRNQGTRPSAS